LGVLLLVILGFIIWLFTYNALWGCIFLIAFILYCFVKRYTALCIMRANRCYIKQDIEKCFRWFERGEKRGMDAGQKITYAYYLLREGHVEKAEALLNSVLAFSLPPELKNRAKSTHSVLLLKTGRLEEAREEMEEIFPTAKNTTLYGNLGYLYILLGDMERAESFNLEAYDYNQDDMVILDNMVCLYSSMGEYEKAYNYAQQLMAKKPHFIEAYYNTAMVEKALGKTADAKTHLEFSLTIRTNFMSAVTHEDVQAELRSLA